MTLKHLLTLLVLLSLAAMSVVTAAYMRHSTREDVLNLYQSIKADMKEQGRNGKHIGKEESDKLMVHSIQGLLLAQKYSITEAAKHYNVSEEFLAKLMDTNPFESNSVNVIPKLSSMNQVRSFDGGNSSVFTIKGFDCPDCNERMETTVSNLSGTPTNSPMMEFTCQGLTATQSGFYLLRPIGTRDRSTGFHIFVHGENIELGCVSTVWLEKGDSVTFKTTTEGRKKLIGFQIRVHLV